MLARLLRPQGLNQLTDGLCPCFSGSGHRVRTDAVDGCLEHEACQTVPNRLVFPYQARWFQEDQQRAQCWRLEGQSRVAHDASLYGSMIVFPEMLGWWVIETGMGWVAVLS